MKAIYFSPMAARWLQSSSPRILHVFERACNLVNGRGDILSLVGTEVGPGPFAVVLPLTQPFDRLASLASPVNIKGASIQLGRVTIDTAEATLWQPVPEWRLLRQRRKCLYSHHPAIHEVLASSPEADTQLAASARSRLAQAATALLHGIAVGDETVCLDGARRLAGLGAGLTPAGDDFLMGVIFALWSTRSEAEASSLAIAIADAAVPRTTALSGAWLRAAARGEAAQPWHDLINRLARPNPSSVNDALARIISIGHSSGADALAGFATALANLVSLPGLVQAELRSSCKLATS